MPDSDLGLEAYKQSCENHRFYGDMRFKQLTLWSVGVGFVLNVLYGKDALGLSSLGRGIWLAAAFFWTAVIWIMEVRSSVHGVRAIRRKSRPEASAPIAPITKHGNSETKGRDQELPNKWTLVNATNAVALLYVGSCLAWAIQLYRVWGSRVITVWVVNILFVFLVAFTIREYFELWQHAVKEWRW